MNHTRWTSIGCEDRVGFFVGVCVSGLSVDGFLEPIDQSQSTQEVSLVLSQSSAWQSVVTRHIQKIRKESCNIGRLLYRNAWKCSRKNNRHRQQGREKKHFFCLTWMVDGKIFLWNGCTKKQLSPRLTRSFIGCQPWQMNDQLIRRWNQTFPYFPHLLETFLTVCFLFFVKRTGSNGSIQGGHECCHRFLFANEQQTQD